MGNPERKESLGAGMTGGHGALPFFNTFMNAFMKGKPIERFPGPPPMPSDIKNLMERNRREELEKLEKADQAAIKSGAVPADKTTTTGADSTTVGSPSGDTAGDGAKTVPSGDPPPIKPPVLQQPVKKPDPPPAEKPEGTKPKGKKGDG